METEALLQKLALYKRTAWLPILEAGEGARDDSKFFGTPYLAPDEAWPVCAHCTEPLRFILQLNLDKIPQACREQFGHGLLQMFYCNNVPSMENPWTSCDGVYGFRPFAKNGVLCTNPRTGALGMSPTL